ncbi:MAG: alpha/beta hydrolase [Bdellovibrionota bacterium]
MPYFSVPGEDSYEMFYEEVPSSASVPTIYIHGNLGCNDWWYPVLSQMKEQGCGRYTETSYLIEFRGCGRSEYQIPKGKLFPIEKIPHDVIAFANFKKLTSYNLVGHSTGGFISLLAGTKDDRIQNIAVIDSVGTFGLSFNDELLKIYDQMKTDASLVEKVMRKTVKHKKQISEETWKGICHYTQVSVGRLGSAIPRALAGVDFTPQFSSLLQPVLVIQGQEDALIPLEVAENLKNIIRKSQLRVLNNIGHSPNIEDPTTVAYILGEFFDLKKINT